MKKLSVLVVVVLLCSNVVYAQMGRGMMGQGMMGQGMMSGEDEGYPYGMGPGMMMRPGMMGMMWGYDANAEQIALDQAAEAVEQYLKAYVGDLELAEIMEFKYNYYAEIEDAKTGVHAMELLVNKYTGQVYPEPGPNMMWNTKYGMMGSRYVESEALAKMPVSQEKAKELAQAYLDKRMPGIKVGGADTFYGYYTLHTFKDGMIEGMLSVNGYSGAVWYHHWHGPFIKMMEYEQH